MAQDPQMAPVVAQVMMNVRQSEVEVEDAVLQVHQAMQQAQAEQQAQAAQAQQGMPGAPPNGVASEPEAQPGMAQPQPSIAAPPQGLTNLTALLTQLRRGTHANVPNELGIAS